MPSPTEPAKHHGLTAKLLHWGTAGLLGYGYLTGVDNVFQLADPGLFVREIVFALVLGGAFLLRYCWMRWVNGPTRLPSDAPYLERISARLTHNGIYIGVGMIVLSGLAIAYGVATPWVGGFFVRAATGVHEFALAATAVLLATHVIGALWHKFFRRDGVWESMLIARRR